MKTVSILCSILLYSIQDAVTVPLSKREVQVQQENVFDVGPLSSCKVPTAADLPICSQYIQYPVPEVLLSDTKVGILEKSIDGARQSAEMLEEALSSQEDAITCGSIVEELECYEKFPACVNDSTRVSFTTEDCETKLGSSCSTDFVKIRNNSYCSTAQFLPEHDDDKTLSLDTCTKVSSTSYNYKYCSNLQGWSDVYLTPWMNVSILNTEIDIKSFIMLSNDPVCIGYYTELKCGEVGRCWDQGKRVEINSTKELCDAVLMCVNSQLRGILEQQLSCSTYPGMTAKLATQATEITEPTVEPPSTMTTQNPMNATSRPTQPFTDELALTTAATEDNGPPTVYFPYPDPEEKTSSATTSGIRSTISTILLLVVSILLTINL